MSKFKHPHNNFFIYNFSQLDFVKGFTKELMPEIAEKINIDTLQIDTTSYVNNQLKDLYSDVIYNCKRKDGNKTKLALLFEHKSSPPKFPHIQLLEYLVSIWRYNIENNEDLTFTIPIIFYHGERKWKRKSFPDYFKNIDKELKKYIPNFEYHLIDLANYDDEELLALETPFLTNTMLAFKHKNDSDYIKTQYLKLFAKLEEYIETETGDRYVHMLSVYLILSTQILGVEIKEIFRKLPPKIDNKMTTTYDNIVSTSLEQGLQQGFERGTKRGIILNEIQSTIKLFSFGVEKNIILANAEELKTELIELIELNIEKEFKSKALQNALAKELIQSFDFLLDEDIVKTCQLEMDEVTAIKQNILRK